ncbi:MAG: alpha-glucan family phosphorylase, partial [Actinobacteria bacterium]|nr:alpha-glucan family phosphorylase [Actinomycetota bacterium]
NRPVSVDDIPPERPVAFLCAEYGIHRSLPIYSGGLGVLAGDILKESSDRALPLVGVGLMYAQGAFHQRLDPAGWQHDYWMDSDPEGLPAALVTDHDGRPLTVTVRIYERDVVVQVWRVDIGRIPLYLLDSNRPENSVVDRWITARLYVGDRGTRLAQYALLGIGGIRALRAMGYDPSVVHLNEGHAALAALELAREEVAAGSSFDEAVASARSRTVFTTHTPVAAGNEAYSPDQIEGVLGRLAGEIGVDLSRLMALGREDPDDEEAPIGMTVLGLRVSRAANGVSDLHGRVARQMWRPLYAGSAEEDVPIGHVTNGVHLPSWMALPMRELLDRHLGAGWEERAHDPATWARVDDIPDEELWEVRCAMRADLVTYLRERSAIDRLARGEPSEYVAAGMAGFHPDALTLGFARRVATYKRVYLLTLDPDRAIRLLELPEAPQLVLAGKAHPQDDEAKAVLASLFRLKWAPHVAERVAYVEDYDLSVAARLVRGCDVWVNLPRPPLEASGTSGMKNALNGGLNLSVLDGWWAEAFDGTNGWGIEPEVGPPPEEQDGRDAMAFYELMEKEVVPLFNERDSQGIPRGWIRLVKSSLRSVGPRFVASRMMADYLRTTYRSS